MNYNQKPSDLESYLPEGQTDFRELFHAFIRRIWLILAIIFVVGLGGAYYALKESTYYRASAVILVGEKDGRIVNVQDVGAQDITSNEAFNTLVTSIRNPKVMLMVVQTNNLAQDPEFLLPAEAPLSKLMVYQWLKEKWNEFRPQKQSAEESPVPLSDEQLAGILRGLVRAERRSGTRLVDISVTHSSKKMARQLANSVARCFIQFKQDQKLAENAQATQQLAKQVEIMRAELKKAEQELFDYEKKHRIVSIEDMDNSLKQRVQELTAEYNAKKRERSDLEGDLKLIEKYATEVNRLHTLPSIRNDPEVSALRQKVNDQKALVDQLATRYTDKMPKMQDERAKLENLKKDLEAQILKSPDRIQAEYESAVGDENRIKEELEAAKEEALQASGKHLEYRDLAREVDDQKALYNRLQQSLNEIDLGKNLEMENIHLSEEATGAKDISEANRKKTFVMALAVGVMLSFGLVFLFHRMDSSVRTVDQAEQVLGMPVLAALPSIKAARNGTLIVADEPDSICSESFRCLRTSLSALGREEETRIVAFTSAIPAEGKTFVSINYAICQAQAGRRTLLIDLDLRRASVGERLGLSKKTPGVSDYFLGKETLANLASKTAYKNFDILPAGPPVPNPAEQLSRDWLNQLIEEAAEKYDRIVLDTAPVNSVSDTFLILPVAQVTCLVVKSGATPKNAIQRALEMIYRNGGSINGIVLNYLPEDSGYGYFYYYAPKGDYYKSTKNAEARAPKAKVA